MAEQSNEPTLKLKTARTLKWNTIDRVSSQILYAVTGIVLANVLSKDDFGLVGAILVFQAFAILFVDSGFGAALLQKKNPAEKDYSTVFYFNAAVSVTVYVVLWFAAPTIAEIFQNDMRLIPLSRVMFLNFIISGLTIVQTNRLMKTMNVKMIAVSNCVAMVVSGGVGIFMALTGWGAWALVWQTLILSTIKGIWLWIAGRWIPRGGFSLDSLREIYRVGLGVFSSSFLNTLFLNIYSFIIGAFYNLASLGVYTQADKWSKMGSASLSQIVTASFVPVLAQYQDNAERYRALIKRINSFTAFVVFPFMVGMTVMATPIFHLLFSTKWDAAILLFQIMSVRGIFVVLTSLYNNYILALGYARSLVIIETVKDVMTVGAIFVTLNFSTIDALVWGQAAAALLTYIFVLYLTARKTGYAVSAFLSDMLPFALITAVAAVLMWFVALIDCRPLMLILMQSAVGCGIYYVALRLVGSKTLDDSLSYLSGRFKRK